MPLSSLLCASFQENELIGLSPFNFSIIIRVNIYMFWKNTEVEKAVKLINNCKYTTCFQRKDFPLGEFKSFICFYHNAWPSLSTQSCAF